MNKINFLRQLTMKRFHFTLILFFSCILSLLSQEELSPLTRNPVLISEEGNTFRFFASPIDDTLQLPFEDDFSTRGFLPDTSKWIRSSSVFINQTLSLNPITLGVATFDGLRSNGYPYNVLAQTGSNAADTLQSKCIRLDSIPSLFIALSPADSIYLSFYYQPKGWGDAPEPGDVLLLDFFNPVTNVWDTKLTLTRSANSVKDSTFTRVMLPVTQTDYFKKNFRFRFRNRNTGCGSVDLWHLDNIYLSFNRNLSDTVWRDVAYTHPAFSLLKNYSSVPFSHYDPSVDMVNNTYVYIRNNNSNPVNITSFLQVKDMTGNLLYFDTTGTGNADPFETNGYVNDPAISSPSLIPYAGAASFVYNSGNFMTDSVTYRVRHFLKNSSFDANFRNDTLDYYQVFSNYFAYDDGSAEAAYGLNQYDAELGVKYELRVADTVRAFDVFFNPVINSGQILNLNFGFYIWDDAGGVPGSVIYKDSLRTPSYTQSSYNAFRRYMLNRKVFLPAGTYYFGMKQEDQLPLNVGFDRNTNTQSKIFYNVSGFWTSSSFKGSLMIRPIVGDSLRAANSLPEVKENNSMFTLFPNPANDEVTVAITGPSRVSSFSITDIFGKLKMKGTIGKENKIQVRNLEEGFYLLNVSDENSASSTIKLIISR